MGYYMGIWVYVKVMGAGAHAKGAERAKGVTGEGGGPFWILGLGFWIG